MTRFTRISIFVLTLFVSAHVANAESFEQVFKVAVGITTCDCGATNTSVVPIGKDPSKRRMRSLRDIIKDLKQKLPRSASTQQGKLRANIARFKKQQQACSIPCERTGAELGLPRESEKEVPSKPTATPTSTPVTDEQGPPTATPSPTPTTPGITPTHTPTPKSTNTPTPTPTPQGCFSANGTTACFGIAPLVGNVDSGSKVWAANSCSGCHSEAQRRGRSYDQVVAAFSKSAMAAVPKPSNQDLAHITAYLNRFSR